MNSKTTIFLHQAKRRMAALMFSLLLILAAQSNMQAQALAPAYVDLDAVQLDQLVAPIALDPDSLVAQILTASTYPDQVAAADTWLNDKMNLTPEQRAAEADTMAWDPAVKGLTAFPAVLDNLAKNTAWTSQLGNAYFNQPGDVMNAIQAMRLQAQQLNVLVTTTQQRVIVEAGVIEIVPVNLALLCCRLRPVSCGEWDLLSSRELPLASMLASTGVSPRGDRCGATESLPFTTALIFRTA
jgi:hypothetical protein